MRTKERSKTADVLHHLQVNKKITSLEAIKLYRATRLSAIIYNLRRRGYNISTEYKPFKDIYGHSARYGIYHYLEKEEENQWIF